VCAYVQKAEDVEIKIPSVTGVNFHGSVIIQNLLRFGNPKPVVSGLFELKPVELRTLCTEASGSHVIGAFLTSDTVGEKSRELLYNKLKVRWTTKFDICGLYKI